MSGTCQGQAVCAGVAARRLSGPMGAGKALHDPDASAAEVRRMRFEEARGGRQSRRPAQEEAARPRSPTGRVRLLSANARRLRAAPRRGLPASSRGRGPARRWHGSGPAAAGDRHPRARRACGAWSGREAGLQEGCRSRGPRRSRRRAGTSGQVTVMRSASMTTSLNPALTIASPTSCMSIKSTIWDRSSTAAQLLRSSARVPGPRDTKATSPPGRSTRQASRKINPAP